MSKEPEPVSDERLRQAVRDVLAEELDQDGDQPSTTRRQVLGSIAAGGVLGGLAGAGSAAGATGGEDTSAMVGSLAGPPYKVADPGLYSGPDSSKSSISHSVGQVHFAQDTGARYYDDGSNWNLLPLQTGRVDLGSHTEIGPSTGLDLAQELRDRIDAGFTYLRVAKPADNSVYGWGDTLSIDPSAPGGDSGARGVKIDIEPGVKVESSYSADWWWDVQVASPQSQEGVFYLDAPDAEFEFTGDVNAAPGVPGFIRVTDVNQPYIDVNTRSFQNGNTDATHCAVRNLDGFIEGSRLSGHAYVADRGVDYIPASESGGTGTESFVDAYIEDLNLSYNDYGLKLSGNHLGNVFDSISLFPKADNSVGVLLDGEVAAIFDGPRFDDTVGLTGTIAWQSGSGFSGGLGGPVITIPRYNNIDTIYDKTDSSHDIWPFRPDADYVQIGAQGTGGVRITRGGGIRTVDGTGTLVFELNNSGQIVEKGFTFFQSGNPVRSNDRLVMLNSGSSTTPEIEVGGSGAGLYVDANGDLYAVDEAGNTNNLTP